MRSSSPNFSIPPTQLSRRYFSQMLAATAAFAFSGRAHAETKSGPSMLLGATDPFCGLDILHMRYAAGRRPSDDISGNALSWLLTGSDAFAQKSLAEMRHSAVPPTGSHAWLTYANWALAFDWLYEHPAFDEALKDRVAKQLLDGATTMAATPDLRHPEQASFHNYTTRFLGLTAFALCAAARHRPHDASIEELRDKAARAFQNILQVSNIVAPRGSYHESMDYMRITYVPMAMLAELQRTTTGVDPALRFGIYRSVADTYLYKLLPDGTPSREGDNEYPILDDRDTAVLGYAVNRFKNPYAAWLLRDSGFAVREWALPVLDFLWNDPDVSPRNPSLTKPEELAHHRHFTGVDQVVFRNGWEPNATRIEFDCGPYLAKHQHLDRGHFTIYHRGYLAIDSGADYTESESPHYLNYYRRTVAHNTMLIFDPKEHFFWSENLLEAANDGGQRMDSSRFWNTVRSRADWEKTRDLWDEGRLAIVDSEEATDGGGSYHYACGDATRAYSPHKLRTFTRQLLYLPGPDVLLVFDRVISTDPAFRKTWLLHGVNMPWVEGTGTPSSNGEEAFGNAGSFRLQEGEGEILVHTLLPAHHITSRRGGPGHEFWTPGDASGGPWGSGRNWPLEPAEGGPLPSDSEELAMWKKFYGDDIKSIERSNHRNVVPGAWRVEVSPSAPQLEDHFLHLFEIGDRGKTGRFSVELLQGSGIAGAGFAVTGEAGGVALFPAQDMPLDYVEVTLPTFPCRAIWVAGLEADRHYNLELVGSNLATGDAPASGVPLRSQEVRANKHGVVQIQSGGSFFPPTTRLSLHAL
ncbi:MAG TPA: heparinase II/III family protein [Acidobacteriaceae bacterium]|nr:heparinase II/III family protein [Acidobacteriaceae bacterium]